MRRLLLPVLLAALGVGRALGAAADSNAAAQDSRVSILTADQVIQILDETVDWYRTLGTQQQNATQPSDLLILSANRQTADKVVALAFEIARANAELLSSEASAGQGAADAASPQSLTQQQNQLDAQRQSIQQEIDAGRKKLASAGKDKQDSEAKLPELQGELAMVNARKNLLDTMTQFVNTGDPKAAGAAALKARIDAIAATIPGMSTAPASAPTAVPSSSAGPSLSSPTVIDSARAAPPRSGIWDLATAVLRQRNKIKTIDLISQHTVALAQTFAKISEEPLKQLKTYEARSDALAAQADNAGSGALKDLRNEFDTLAWLFKQTSDILLPLAAERILLQQYQHNLRA